MPSRLCSNHLNNFSWLSYSLLLFTIKIKSIFISEHGCHCMTSLRPAITTSGSGASSAGFGLASAGKRQYDVLPAFLHFLAGSGGSSQTGKAPVSAGLSVSHMLTVCCHSICFSYHAFEFDYVNRREAKSSSR